MSTTTNDLDAQIAKLEEKLNQLLDKVQEIPSSQSQESTPPPTTQETSQPPASQESTSPPPPQQTTSGSEKSRKEILEEYEKGYLTRMEEQKRADQEIQRAVAELQAKKQAEQSSNQPSSTRGSLPKGF